MYIILSAAYSRVADFLMKIVLSTVYIKKGVPSGTPIEITV
jgi:hypothetical protein